MVPLTASSCEHLFKGSVHPIPALAGMGTSPQQHLHLPSVCCNACVPAMHVCCNSSVLSHILHRASAMLGCALLPAQCCVCCQPGCRGTGEPAPGGSAREGAAADSLSMAGRTCGLWLRHARARSMSTGAVCRTSSAHSDRQGWASGGAGRGRPTVRGGGTWTGRRARAQERGHAVPGEGMLGKC
jgi:hypothetical protein